MPKGVYVRQARAGELPAEHIEDTKIEQKPDITGEQNEHPSEIVEADPSIHGKKQFDELAFNEEPVTIRLEPSGQENAPDTFGFIGVNGKPAEIWINGGWVECGYLPIDQVITTKRKYLAVILSSKIDSVRTTEYQPEDVFIGNRPTGNKVKRKTSQSISVSIIEDRNPRGADWVREIRRRNF